MPSCVYALSAAPASVLILRLSHILVFTKTNGWRHSSIPAGIECIKKMGKNEGWDIKFTEDSLDINDSLLAKTDVLVFLNTTGTILGKKGRSALQNFMANGGGFVGIHSATDTESDWLWYTNLIGGVFKNHPQQQEATVQILDQSFPATSHFGKTWKHFDEWYNFREPIRSNCIVLATLDENSYTGGEMNNHPILWYQYYEGGRVFYTGMGHTDETYQNEYFTKMINKGIKWAGKKLDTKPLNRDWKNLMDDKLTNFDTYTGVSNLKKKNKNTTRDIQSNNFVDKVSRVC
ncbi:MAG: ThuA domain-containing protein [Saprospiraceae bacterium]|nr:ThuA domain-containing protein [Saprospiraceae bacterium]